MTDRCETFRDCIPTIPSSFLQVSNPYTIPCGFCVSPNEQNQMFNSLTMERVTNRNTTKKSTIALFGFFEYTFIAENILLASKAFSKT